MNNILRRLREEKEATKNLVNEGDPFLMTRNDYLQNLEWILQDDKTQLTEKVKDHNES